MQSCGNLREKDLEEQKRLPISSCLSHSLHRLGLFLQEYILLLIIWFRVVSYALMIFNRIFATTIWCLKSGIPWMCLLDLRADGVWPPELTEQFQLYFVNLRERGRPLSGPGELHWNWEKRMNPWQTISLVREVSNYFVLV